MPSWQHYQTMTVPLKTTLAFKNDAEFPLVSLTRMLHGLTERKGPLLCKHPTSELNTESAVCPVFLRVLLPAHWALRWNVLSSRLLELIVFLFWERFRRCSF